MSAEVKKEIQLEIAHVLFVDIVGYSKLSINEQRAAVDELNELVRTSDQFQKAQTASALTTSDGRAQRSGERRNRCKWSRQSRGYRPQHGAADDGLRRCWAHSSLQTCRRRFRRI